MPLTGGHRPTHAGRVTDQNPAHAERVSGHKPVLLQEVLHALTIHADDIVLDATLGGAGHAREMVKLLGSKGVLIGIDADSAAIERAREALQGTASTVRLVEGNFRDVISHTGKHEIPHITKALFDLGWSGYQLVAGRGFSFLKEEPLLMTYAAAPGPETLTAEKIVNTWEESSIADIIFGWGEERFARQIARGIVAARKETRIATSRELAEIVRASVPAFYRKGRLHPATKTFQALRIAVNDEMGALKEGLRGAWQLLVSRGRLAVITFHSVEDREVKRLMKEWVNEGSGQSLTKSPIRPAREEVLANPRARSAKLRVIEKQ